jgi:hypothetical protein
MKTVTLLLLLTLSLPLHAKDCAQCISIPPWLTIFNPFALPAVPDPEPLIQINTPTLPRDPGAKYCRRDPQVVDTIVFHHTETTSLRTVQDINNMHLDRGTANDPWLMIGYHYTINAPYPGNTNPAPSVNQGRPFDLAGSHAGSDVFKPASAETKRLMARAGAMRCGPANGPLAEADDKFNAAGNVKANYNTVAIAVIGNYARRSSSNPNGYTGSPRYPSAQTIDMAARLACQLQRENPRLTEIKWHNYYKATSCPGLIKNRIAQIKQAAARYGCTFN